MRSFVFAASTAALAILATVELASAAATPPDYELHVNTRSAYEQDGRSVDLFDRASNAAIDPVAQPAEPEWLEIPARR